MYFRRALDKLGVEPDFTRIGKYKSAAETFTDSVMSSPTREQYSELLDDWYERTVRAIATSRGVSVDSVRALVNRAPYTARDAVAYGLVDSVGHEDRAFESAKTMVKAREGRVSGKINLAQRRLYSEAWGPHPQVAVVFATGEIVTGRGGGDFLSGSQAMGAETMAKALRQVRKNNRVKAVVLRVDSPGGSALASDIIWREMQLLWETDKPVVISVGDLAASGGYYIACRGDSIVANAGSIVGSIGVFDGKFVVQRLANRLGVDYELLARGDNALINSALARRTPEQQQRVADNVRQVYDVFVDRVAQGRGMTASRVDSLGQGRIYTAANAVNIGLVDRLGGLEDAVEIAMRMAGISGEVEILPYPRRSHILETVMRNSVEENAAWGLRWEDANGVLFYDATAASMR
jgi:protease-4